MIFDDLENALWALSLNTERPGFFAADDAETLWLLARTALSSLAMAEMLVVEPCVKPTDVEICEAEARFAAGGLDVELPIVAFSGAEGVVLCFVFEHSPDMITFMKFCLKAGALQFCLAVISARVNDAHRFIPLFSKVGGRDLEIEAGALAATGLGLLWVSSFATVVALSPQPDSAETRQRLESHRTPRQRVVAMKRAV